MEYPKLQYLKEQLISYQEATQHFEKLKDDKRAEMYNRLAAVTQKKIDKIEGINNETII